jgi:hypothetical protein
MTKCLLACAVLLCLVSTQAPAQCPNGYCPRGQVVAPQIQIWRPVYPAQIVPVVPVVPPEHVYYPASQWEHRPVFFHPRRWRWIRR